MTNYEILDSQRKVKPVMLKYMAYNMLNNCLNKSEQCPYDLVNCPVNKHGKCDEVEVKDWILALADNAFLFVEENRED